MVSVHQRYPWHSIAQERSHERINQRQKNFLHLGTRTLITTYRKTTVIKSSSVFDGDRYLVAVTTLSDNPFQPGVLTLSDKIKPRPLNRAVFDKYLKKGC